ncbi:MAG: disulfide bond formation DsbB family protein [Xanthomonadaceae bacterium]|nr:disulfide bond formation DsbB family protein [Xanthomonadaceae bacterium]
MNPLQWSFRTRCLLGFAICLALLGFALYSQLHTGLEPCPLCVFQRIAFAAVGLILLFAGLHAPKAAVVRASYGLFALLAAVLGIAIAGRQVWLQHLPPEQVPMCGPGLNYLVEAMPLTSVIRKVLTGSGECARVDWTFLGFSMAEWSLLWFIFLAAWAGLLLVRRR